MPVASMDLQICLSDTIVLAKFVYDENSKKYIGKYLTFENMKTEIERYNNTPEGERDLPQGSINNI